MIGDEEKLSKGKLIGEPISREDGLEVSFWDYGHDDEVTIKCGTIDATYTKDEVELLGGGVFTEGLFRIGRAYLDADDSQIGIGSVKLLTPEIKELKEK